MSLSRFSMHQRTALRGAAACHEGGRLVEEEDLLKELKD
jgi:hypothetical protein